MSSLVRMRGVSKVYRSGSGQRIVEVEALRDVDLDIDEGEYVAITGPSGSGKSTLMHLIGLLDTPTTGSYLLNDLEVARLRVRELAIIRNRRIGFVFQGFFLLPRLTALHNVELPLVYRGISFGERQRRARVALSAVGLDDRTHHLPNELSGGQKQRVAIARALVQEPDLLLADEPTGNLDSKASQEIMEIFAGLHGAGRTIVLVTHEADVAAHARRQITVFDGRITA